MSDSDFWLTIRRALLLLSEAILLREGWQRDPLLVAARRALGMVTSAIEQRYKDRLVGK